MVCVTHFIHFLLTSFRRAATIPQPKHFQYCLALVQMRRLQAPAIFWCNNIRSNETVKCIWSIHLRVKQWFSGLWFHFHSIFPVQSKLAHHCTHKRIIIIKSSEKKQKETASRLLSTLFTLYTNGIFAVLFAFVSFFSIPHFLWLVLPFDAVCESIQFRAINSSNMRK